MASPEILLGIATSLEELAQKLKDAGDELSATAVTISEQAANLAEQRMNEMMLTGAAYGFVFGRAGAQAVGAVNAAAAAAEGN